MMAERRDNILHRAVLRLMFILLLASVVHACGFHLRGSLSLTEDVGPVYLQQNNVFQLAREVKSLLASNEVELAERAAGARSHLSLLSESKSTRVLSVDGSGQAKEYLLQYRVNIAIRFMDARERTETVSVSRDLNFDSTAVLGFANERDILYDDMRKQAAQLILLKLQALARNSDLNQETEQEPVPATGQPTSMDTIESQPASSQASPGTAQ